MPVPFREVFFGNDRLESERVSQTNDMLALIEALPGYTELDRLIFVPIVEDLIISQMHIRDLDRRLVSAPEEWTKLEKMRSSTSTRLGRLRKQLQDKIKELTKKDPNAAPSGLEALAAMSSEDYQP